MHGIAFAGIRFTVAAYRDRSLKISAGIPVFGGRTVRIVVLIIVRALIRAVADLKVAVLSRRTRQTVVDDDLVRVRIDPVNEDVVVIKIRIAFMRQRHFKVVCRVPVFIHQDSHRCWRASRRSHHCLVPLHRRQ